MAVLLEPEDAVVVQYLQARYSKEGQKISQAELLRKMISPTIKRIRERIAEELQAAQETHTENSTPEDDDDDNDDDE